MDKLKVSKNKRNLVTENDERFIWLADTNWTMPQRIKFDDIEYLMKKRKSQGFTVLQIVALDPEQDREIRNPLGEKALLNDDLNTPNENYFKYLDWIIDKAEEYGLYILLLPTWGELVVGHNWMGETSEKIVNESNSYQYGQWIGNRYKDRNNIIWCLGGDRMPFHLDEDYRTVWRLMAEGLAKGLLGKDLKYNENKEEWEKILLTYHACHESETGKCSTMSYWTDEEKWISFITIQSGHGLTPKNYELIEKEYKRLNTMPVFDGEPAYEKMPTSWPVIKGFHDDWIVRKRAYWSLFAGSFGHTYGHGSIWCSISEREKDGFRPYSWIESLDHPGAWQIKILRDFMEAVNLNNCIPSQEILLEQSKKEIDVLDEHIQACSEINGAFSCVYFPSGGEDTISLKHLKAETIQIWWFNPKDGKFYSQNNEITEKSASKLNKQNNDSLKITTPTKGEREDWICIVKNENYFISIESAEYGDMIIPQEVKKVFNW